jgi:hypothetical protein
MFDRKSLTATLVTIGLAGLGTPVSATSPDLLMIGVQVANSARTPTRTLVRAMQEATEVYRHARLRIVWVKELSLPADSPADRKAWQAFNETELRLRVRIADSATANMLPQDVVGIATGTPAALGCQAYVFYDRIQALTQAREMSESDEAYVLGNVIAHELGHLLLPYPAHSDTGVMRAFLDDRQLSDAAGDTLRFSRNETELIRSAVSKARATLRSCGDE